MVRATKQHEAAVRRVVELACLAPSFHNTQPWLWRATGDGLELYADLSRVLAAEDGSHRNLTLSCGAALHHLRVVAAALAWDAEIERTPEGPDSPLLARVRLRRGPRSATAAEDLAALHDRCTDRRRFTAWPIPAGVLSDLVRTATDAGAGAVAVVEPGARFRLELIANRAAEVTAADRRVRAEQDRWVDRGTGDGIPRRLLPAEASGRRPSRFGPGLLTDTRAEVESGDGIVVLGAASDDVPAWLRSGEGMSALWLHATRIGLSVVPLSQAVELDGPRAELHDAVLAGSIQPHLLLRIGWQAIGRSELPRTPRRPVDEVLLPGTPSLA
jgi:hypothetical protein